MNEIQVCQTDYLAAEDLGGKNPVVTISRVSELSKAEREAGKRPSKDVIIHFQGKQKGMRTNVTNQWAIAFLLGSKKASDWIGKKITLTTDTDADIENGGETLCLRIAGSPDAPAANQAAYTEIWGAGPRIRGKLVKRLKSRFRLLSAKATPTAPQDPPAAEPQQPAEPTIDPASNF